jgi:hypothetical protein
MKYRFHALALVLGLGLAMPAVAQNDPAKEEPAKDVPAKEEPAKTEPAKDAPATDEAPKTEPAKDEAAPAATPAPAAAAAAAPTPAPAPAAAAAPAKELTPSAKAFVPLADSYKSAYDDMQKWIGQIDTQTAASNDKSQKLQTQVQENETAITQAKLKGDNAKVKDLQKQNKSLWDQINAAKKEQADTTSKFAKDAAQRVKQYTDATNKALDAIKSQK